MLLMAQKSNMDSEQKLFKMVINSEIKASASLSLLYLKYV